MGTKFKFKQWLGSEFEIEVKDGKPICHSCGVESDCKHRYFAVTKKSIRDEFNLYGLKLDPVEVASIKKKWESKSIFFRLFQ